MGFAEDFSNALVKINEFLSSGSYEPYSELIDFLFFSLLFISVYMIGARYAFRELGKPEKMIAVVLGIFTSLLLVLEGFSITLLLPYVQWVLYILVFIVTSFLLKGIKSKFLRFVLALLITLLLIGLMSGFFAELELPENEFI